jgi:hypothetical protein
MEPTAMTKSLRISVVSVAALLMSTGINGSAPLRIQVSPAISRAPAQVTVRLIVESDAQNRTLQIVATSDDYYRSSEVQLDGKDAQSLNVFEFRNLPPGTYQITGVLVGSSGPRATVSGLARVEPMGGSR